MSDKSSIIRHESAHSVSFPEGSQVATSKPSDAQGPQVRKTLSGEEYLAVEESNDAAGAVAIPPPFVRDTSSDNAAAVTNHEEVDRPVQPPAPPPPMAFAQASDSNQAGAVFERAVAGESIQVALPPELAPLADQLESPVDQFLRERRLAMPAHDVAGQAGSQAPVFERTTGEHRTVLPEDVPGSNERADGLVFERSMVDHYEPAAQDLPAPAAATDGSVFERSMREHREALPADGPSLTDPSGGPVIERSVQDRRVAIPEPPLQAQREADSLSPLSGRTEPALEPVPLAQAQQVIAEAARETQAKVEQAIGAADGQWAEMDFPARVVKLKIENDKVRVKLDELEDLADRQAR